MKSMTGFGKSSCQHKDKSYIIEIKTLNSKQLDANIRVPGFLKEFEIPLRNLLIVQFVRGKCELTIRMEAENSEKPSKINKHLVKDYYRQLDDLAHEIGDKHAVKDLMSIVMRLPDVLSSESVEIETEEWKAIENATLKACETLNQFRIQEGNALHADIEQRINNINELAERIPAFESERTDRIKQKLHDQFKEWKDNEVIDENRFEQELIYYLEKLDITEEKVRLQNHLEYFNTAMSESDAVGRKLSFIGQEIGREINTIGSKANHAEIQRIVVQMKDELEKIKEQLMNVL